MSGDIVVVAVIFLLKGEDKSFVASDPLFDYGYRFTKELVDALMKDVLVAIWDGMLECV